MFLYFQRNWSDEPVLFKMLLLTKQKILFERRKIRIWYTGLEDGLLLGDELFVYAYSDKISIS